MEANGADMQALAKLAIDTQKIQVVASEAGHFAVIPEGQRLVSLKEYQEYEKPIKKHGTVTVIDVPGMAGFFNRFKDANSMIFGNPDNNTFTGVLDYHSPEDKEGRECKFRVAFSMRTTDRWDTWEENNKVAMAQEQFATFIEDNLPDIYTPDGKMPSAADMLEVSRTLQVTGGHKFNQQTNLKDGSRHFSYVEDNAGVAGAKGEVAVPDKFCIRMPIFMNQPPVTIECRLRYRINSGKMSMWYDLFRIDELLDKEFETARAAVAAACETYVTLSTSF